MLWVNPATFCRPLASMLRPVDTGSGASAAVTVTDGVKLTFGAPPPRKSMPRVSALVAAWLPLVHWLIMVTPNHATLLPLTV